jgi:hypothetical protein
MLPTLLLVTGCNTSKRDGDAIFNWLNKMESHNNTNPSETDKSNHAVISLAEKFQFITKTEPNQAPEPMTMSVTDAAAQPPRQPRSWLS